jgi:hypothetical protein
MRTLAMALLAGTLSLGGVGAAWADESGASAKGHPDTKHESVKLSDLPAAARKTLEHEAQGGKLQELCKDTSKNGTVSYEAEVVKDGKGTDVAVSEKGMLLERGKTHEESGEREHHEK